MNQNDNLGDAIYGLFPDPDSDAVKEVREIRETNMRENDTYTDETERDTVELTITPDVALAAINSTEWTRENIQTLRRFARAVDHDEKIQREIPKNGFNIGAEADQSTSDL